MKLFFLDDDLNRKQQFKRRFPDAEIVFAETASEAILKLSEDLTYDAIFLDHDLGGRIFVASEEENTGYQVAKFLSDKVVEGRIIIHSWNAVGAKRMLELLPGAVHVPFSITK